MYPAVRKTQKVMSVAGIIDRRSQDNKALGITRTGIRGIQPIAYLNVLHLRVRRIGPAESGPIDLRNCRLISSREHNSAVVGVVEIAESGKQHTPHRCFKNCVAAHPTTARFRPLVVYGLQDERAITGSIVSKRCDNAEMVLQTIRYTAYQVSAREACGAPSTEPSRIVAWVGAPNRLAEIVEAGLIGVAPLFPAVPMIWVLMSLPPANGVMIVHLKQSSAGPTAYA